ncbi:MAG: PQQ-binding-like beta-propeller repeat protein [Thermomicrobiales bacterium]|nr:PQQ-binding-like beta-propeller repeat protein [Thermomicrobiales bacterium]
MSIAIKTCSACGQVNPAFHAFCPICGASLVDSTSRSAPWTISSRFPPLAAAVDPERKRKRRQPVPEGHGVGFVWAGFLLAAFPIAIGTGSTLALTTWGAGVLLVVVGFWLMRRDLHTLSRAGLATNGIALVSLAIIGIQVISTENEQRNPRMLAVVTPTPTRTPTPVPDWAVPTEVATPDARVAMFRGDAAHTGVNPGPGITGRPMRQWRFDTAGELYSSPVVANGLVYVGTKSGFVFALELETSTVRWRADLGDNIIIKSSPAVMDDRIVIAAGHSLVALDPLTGAKLWQANTPPLSESSPSFANERIFVASSASSVYAFEAATGRQAWSFQADGLIKSSPAIVDEVLFVGTDDGKLYALNTKTGQTQWQFQTVGGIFSSPAVADGRVYVTSIAGKTYAITVAGNTQKTALWQYDAGGEASPVVAGGKVYVAAADGGLYAFDAVDGGAPIWLFPTGAKITSSPAYAEGVLYVASGKTLYAVDSATGAELWRMSVGYVINTSPVVINGFIFIGGKDGYLDAITGDGAV